MGCKSSVQLKFYAWKSGDDIPVNVSAILNFGSKSSTVPLVTLVDDYIISSDDPKVYFSRFTLHKVTIPKDIGDDQYLLLQFSLPVNRDTVSPVNKKIMKIGSKLPKVYCEIKKYFQMCRDME